MKVFKRIITSIKRNFGHSFIMFLIVFILGNVLFASIAVSQTSKQVEQKMKDRIPSGITIEENTDTFIYGYMHTQLMELFENLKQDEDVEKIIQFDALQVLEKYEMHEDGSSWFSDFVLCVNDFDALIEGLNIVEGRNFKKSDLESDRYKIVIDQDFEFDYKVGDIYTLPIWDYKVINYDPDNSSLEFYVKDKIEFEVIGMTSHYNYETVGLNYNSDSIKVIPKIWADEIIKRQEDILDSHPIKDKGILYDRVIKHIDDISKIRVLKSFIKVSGMDAADRLAMQIKKDDLYSNQSFVLRSSSQDYVYIQAPLENLKALANVTMWSSAILVVVLLSLVSTLFIRNRKQEIGILMALGETKFKLIMQFACEIILVGLLATTFSMVSGNKLGSFISNEFMKIQIDTEAELEYQENHKNELTQLDMLDAYEVNIDGQYIMAIYGISFIVLVISTMLPVIFITRIEPKKVMLP